VGRSSGAIGAVTLWEGWKEGNTLSLKPCYNPCTSSSQFFRFSVELAAESSFALCV
jgi:hypothetical protein